MFSWEIYDKNCYCEHKVLLLLQLVHWTLHLRKIKKWSDVQGEQKQTKQSCTDYRVKFEHIEQFNDALVLNMNLIDVQHIYLCY